MGFLFKPAPFFKLISAIGLLLLSVSSVAHQQKAGITNILINERSGKLEVAHRFYLHDAEHAIKHLFGKSADIYRDEKTQQRFADYLSSEFAIRTDDGRSVELDTLGYELDGKFIWVYQEIDIPKPLPGVLWFKQGALRALWSKQINTVNIEARNAKGARLGEGKALSLSFSAGDDWKSIELPEGW
ncbi:DUF6702 family protein [Pseudoteredinibacter isoporae]|uniref:GLPGLI family protein n=1 Tax=Pseudoteredinibacter isoporae TaxID=570281 RepID=A0A7X0MY45_9GAMM|nr:DUF6702 family protein [Pseudoteredinibacter isoporae]MBB6522679.1 hypothetical protein [Pseudoteredinibacter isoporae]NHO88209.1 hypothetical protein [Pseudoteredinibacter isoporae]NIB23460.1 hypothetical protein [Pseudoteredinibacter isoporae]